MAIISKKGALGVSTALDRLANLFTEEFATLGVPERIASDFAHRCDLLSDTVERRAGLKRTALTGDDVFKEPGFDPEAIGQEQTGPIVTVDSDEPFMKGEFTQQENRELSDRQESGALGAKANPEPEAPHAGKQAHSLRRQLQSAVIAGKSPRLVQALALAAKVAEEEEEEEAESKKADAMPPQFKENAEKKKEEAKDKKDEAKKKAGEMPPQFKEQAEKKKEEAKDKKEDAKKAGDDFIEKKKEEAEDEKKKASHGFNLFA